MTSHWHQTLWTPQHHYDHQDTENQHPVFTEQLRLLQYGHDHSGDNYPRNDPMPPNTTIARMMADSMKVNDSGLIKP